MATQTQEKIGSEQSSELTSITSPSGAQVGYNYDFLGQLIGVTGAGYWGVSNYASGLTYRAFGGLKNVSYGNSRTLQLKYDQRMRLSKWDTQGLLGYTYEYSNYGENSTGRVTYAHSLYDGSLDRSWHYDQVGRLDVAYSGSEARATIGTDTWGHPDGPYAQGFEYDQLGNMTHNYGWGGYMVSSADQRPTYSNNHVVGLGYDAAGNLTSDGSRSFTYDATGRQATASGTGLTQFYDGARLRVWKTENGVTTYYV